MFRSLSSFLPLVYLLSACGAESVVVPGQERAGGPVGPHKVVVKSVWAEQSETPGKQHIAVLDDDVYTHSDHFLLFGEKKGKLHVRDFVSSFIFAEAGSVEKAADDFYQLTANFVSDDQMEVTLLGQNGSKFKLVYDRLDDDDVADAAVEAADKFYGKFDKLLDKDVATLSDLKAYVRLHIRSHDFSPEDDKNLEWQFSFEEFLQIGGVIELANANKKLAGVTIKASGSDAISKHFKKKFGKTWTADADLPEAEEVLTSLGDFDDAPKFLQFQNEIIGVDPGPIRDGLEKFAKQTVTLLNPLECEDSFDYARDFFWVLEDGSILSYFTEPECD
jgi:hypothetical protein